MMIENYFSEGRTQDPSREMHAFVKLHSIGATVEAGLVSVKKL